MMADPGFIAERRDRLVGLVITHAHEDHIGAVAWLWPQLKCPVYCTPFAAAVLRRACPERLIVGVPAREILLGGGGIHCITQQIPSYEILRTRPGPGPGAKLH